jgi:hypothetical protein
MGMTKVARNKGFQWVVSAGICLVPLVAWGSCVKPPVDGADGGVNEGSVLGLSLGKTRLEEVDQPGCISILRNKALPTTLTGKIQQSDRAETPGIWFVTLNLEKKMEAAFFNSILIHLGTETEEFDKDLVAAIRSRFDSKYKKLNLIKRSVPAGYDYKDVDHTLERWEFPDKTGMAYLAIERGVVASTPGCILVALTSARILASAGVDVSGMSERELRTGACKKGQVSTHRFEVYYRDTKGFESAIKYSQQYLKDQKQEAATKALESKRRAAEKY